MTTALGNRREDMFRSRVRKLVRRGATTHLSRLLGKVRPEDVAAVLEDFTEAEQKKVFDVLLAKYPEAAGDVLSTIDAPERVQLLNMLSSKQIASSLEHVPVDDAVLIVDSLPEESRAEVLDLVSRPDLAGLQGQLAYEDDSAGRIMTSEFFALPETTSVESAVQAIRGARDMEMIFYLYVVDQGDKLVGVVSLRQLLLSKPDLTLQDVMTRSVITVTPDTDQEAVATCAMRYDLLAIPVVDEEQVLVGIITVDDIIDVVKEEATEDFFKMVGTSDDELLYQEQSWKVARIRLPWILVNGLGLLVTGTLLRIFQASVTEAIFLLSFVPIVMGMGGNIGSQTSTIAVRGLATGRITFGQGRARGFFLQQARIGALIGVLCATAAGAAAYATESNPYFSLVVGGALFVVIMLASCNGALVPILFQRLGIDPAVAAGPLVTTFSDIVGVCVYFGFAFLMIDLLVR